METTATMQTTKKLMFRSELNRPKPHMYAQGKFRKDMDKYEELIDKKTGKTVLEITERIPFDDQIQEHKSSVTLDSLLERYKIDLSKKAITEISEDIADMTIMPQDALECYSMIHEAEKNFQDSTKEFKAEFNNNFGEYLKGFANGKTQQVVDKYHKKLIKSEYAQNSPVTAQMPISSTPTQQTAVSADTTTNTASTPQNTYQGVNLNA